MVAEEPGQLPGSCGQICSAVAVLDEISDGVPSLVAPDPTWDPQLSSAEVAERSAATSVVVAPT